ERGASHGAHGLRREGGDARRRQRRGGEHGGGPAPGHAADGHRERLRQAQRDLRIPGLAPGRQGHHHHQDHRAERRGGGGEGSGGRGRTHDHHPLRADDPHAGQGHLGHRPQHPGSALGQPRRGGGGRPASRRGGRGDARGGGGGHRGGKRIG